MPDIPPKLRPPSIGDVLLDPQRAVIFVDRTLRTFRCSPLHGTPGDHYRRDELPTRMQDAPFTAAPIEPGWTELPMSERPFPG